MPQLDCSEPVPAPVRPPLFNEAPVTEERLYTAADTSREVTVYIDDAVCDFGSIISGHIRIVPRTTGVLDAVTLMIWSRERAGQYGGGAPAIASTCTSAVPLHINKKLSTGFAYRIFFSMQFPLREWPASCKCGSGEHDVLPPSLTNSLQRLIPSVSSTYSIKASIDGRIVAMSYLDFSPRSIEQFSKPISNVRQLPISLRTKLKSPGKLEVKLLPSIYMPSDSSIVDIHLSWYPNSRLSQVPAPPAISRIDYRMVQDIKWVNSHGQEFKQRNCVSSSTVRVQCNWDNNRATIHMPYNAPHQGQLQVSYTGCLTAVSYSMIVFIAGASYSSQVLVGGDGLPTYRDLPKY